MKEIKKTCTKCLLEKSLSEFSNSKKGKFKKQPKCKLCNKLYREANRDSILIYLNNYYLENKEELTIKNSERTKNNYEKVSEYKRNWYENNRTLLLEKAKIRYNENKESIKEYKREYYLLNKDSIQLKNNSNKKERLQNDFLFFLKEKVSNCIRTSLKSKKSKRSSEILGCSIEKFKQHIESQFLPWMNWENYGDACEILEYSCSWDLDHIVPTSYAKNEEELYLLNHWSNFQPLCSKINRLDKKAKMNPVTNLELKITFE